jgi:hypothetical protein
MRSPGPANLFASDLIVASSPMGRHPSGKEKPYPDLLLTIQSCSTVMALHRLQYNKIIYIQIIKGSHDEGKMSDESPRLELVILILHPGKKVPEVYPRASKLENLGKNLGSALH